MLLKKERSPNEMYPSLSPSFSPLSQSKAISPRGRFENPKATAAASPSDKLGRFPLKFVFPRISRQEIRSCLTSLRIFRQNENIPLYLVEKGDTKIVGVNPPGISQDLAPILSLLLGL